MDNQENINTPVTSDSKRAGLQQRLAQIESLIKMANSPFELNNLKNMIGDIASEARKDGLTLDGVENLKALISERQDQVPLTRAAAAEAELKKLLDGDIEKVQAVTTDLKGQWENNLKQSANEHLTELERREKNLKSMNDSLAKGELTKEQLKSFEADCDDDLHAKRIKGLENLVKHSQMVDRHHESLSNMCVNAQKDYEQEKDKDKKIIKKDYFEKLSTEREKVAVHKAEVDKKLEKIKAREKSFRVELEALEKNADKPQKNLSEAEYASFKKSIGKAKAQSAELNEAMSEFKDKPSKGVSPMEPPTVVPSSGISSLKKKVESPPVSPVGPTQGQKSPESILNNEEGQKAINSVKKHCTTKEVGPHVIKPSPTPSVGGGIGSRER